MGVKRCPNIVLGARRPNGTAKSLVGAGFCEPRGWAGGRGGLGVGALCLWGQCALGLGLGGDVWRGSCTNARFWVLFIHEKLKATTR